MTDARSDRLDGVIRTYVEQVVAAAPEPPTWEMLRARAVIPDQPSGRPSRSRGHLRIAAFAAVTIVIVGVVGVVMFDRDDSTDRIAVPPVPNTEPSAAPVTSDAVARFSAAIERSPLWVTTRRVAPPEGQHIVDFSTGFVRGKIVGVAAGDGPVLSEQELEEEIGVPLEGIPVPPNVVAQDILLEIAVSEIGGAVGGDAATTETVLVPIPVWFGGDTPHRVDAVQSIIDDPSVDDLIGAEVFVFVSALSDGVDSVARPPADVLASVVFSTSDSGLVSLDWLIADRVEEHFGADSFDELADLTMRP